MYYQHCTLYAQHSTTYIFIYYMWLQRLDVLLRSIYLYVSWFKFIIWAKQTAKYFGIYYNIYLYMQYACGINNISYIPTYYIDVVIE